MPGNIFLKDGFYYCTHITGPTHNLLGLRFGPAPGEFALTRLPVHCSEGRIDEAQLTEAIQRGVASAGTALFVLEARYVPDDTPAYGTYEGMAHRITRYAASVTAEEAP